MEALRHLVADRVFHDARGTAVDQRRRMAGIDQRRGMTDGIEDGGRQGYEPVPSRVNGRAGKAIATVWL